MYSTQQSIWCEAGSRYGVKLAYALFTSTFFIHNEDLSAKLEKRVPRPIIAYSNNVTECNEHFGLVDPKRASQVDTSEIGMECGTPKVKMDTLSFDDVKQQLTLLQGKPELSEHDVRHQQ